MENYSNLKINQHLANIETKITILELLLKRTPWWAKPGRETVKVDKEKIVNA
jgi:hypothetical protein